VCKLKVSSSGPEASTAFKLGSCEFLEHIGGGRLDFVFSHDLGDGV